MFGPSTPTAAVIESANIFIDGEDDPIAVLYQSGVPAWLQMPDGTTISFIYGSTSVSVDYLLANGEFGFDVQLLSPDLLATLDELRMAADTNRAALAAGGTQGLEGAQGDSVADLLLADLTGVRSFLVEVFTLGANSGEVIAGSHVTTTIEGSQLIHQHVTSANIFDTPFGVHFVWDTPPDQSTEAQEARAAALREKCADERERNENILGTQLQAHTSLGVVFERLGGAFTFIRQVFTFDFGAPPQVMGDCDQDVTVPSGPGSATLTVRAEHPYTGGATTTVEVDPGGFLTAETGDAITVQLQELFPLERLCTEGGTFDPFSIFVPPGFTSCDQLVTPPLDGDDDGAAPPSLAPFGTTNLIVNGDAETGGAGSELADVIPPPGWTVTGDFRQMVYDAGYGFPTAGEGPPGHGSAFFSGGDNDTISTATQVIELSGDQLSAINAGGVQYDVSGWFGGFAGQDDRAVLTVAFLTDKEVLDTVQIGGVLAADRGGATGFREDSAFGAVAGDTTAIRVTVTMHRASGSANDGYADELELRLFRD